MKKSILTLLTVLFAVLSIHSSEEKKNSNELKELPISITKKEKANAKAIFTVNVNGNIITAYNNGVIKRNGRQIYKGQKVLAMINYKGYLITAFEQGGIYKSYNGTNPAGGGNATKVYKGKQKVTGMKNLHGGVLTTFDQGGSYLSPDGNNLGGGGNTKRYKFEF